jgi:hypothetical protein
MEFTTFAKKLSVKLEDNRGITSHYVNKVKLSNYDSYVLYTNRPYDIRVIENLENFLVYVENENDVEPVTKGINYIVSSSTGTKRLSVLKCYLIGLNERGINACLVTSGVRFYAGEENDANIEVYRSTSSINLLTESYRYRSMNSYVYEVLADNQGTLSELRIGDFGATYCLRKLYKKFFPERVSEMYIAGKTIEIYEVHNWGLPKVSVFTSRRRPRVSSAFRELLDDSFDYDFLDRMEESARKFDLHGEKLDGHFFYDYRGRMYWSGNINPQGEQKNRHLSLNGVGITEYDATCSGIQLGSILSGNVAMMKKTNVISTGTKEKQDAYGYIANKACEEMGIPVGSIPRSVAKKPVMLLPYGAAARTMIGHAISAAEEEIELGNIPEEVSSKYTANELGKGVYRAVEHHIARDVTYEKILELIDVKVFSKNGKDYGQYCSWTTPDGLNVNSYSKLDASKINQMLSDGADLLHTYKHTVIDLELGGNQYKCDVMYVEGCNIRFFKNDTPNIGQLVPNFIHSLDATALRYVCKKLLDQGHDVFPIHDCVIISEELTQDYISSLFREAYQFIADYYNCDVTVDGMVVFPE